MLLRRNLGEYQYTKVTLKHPPFDASFWFDNYVCIVLSNEFPLEVQMWLLLDNLLGCITKIVDRFTVDRIVGQAKTVGDTQMPQSLGESKRLDGNQTKRKFQIWLL